MQHDIAALARGMMLIQVEYIILALTYINFRERSVYP
jgi:hypothetical protein